MAVLQFAIQVASYTFLYKPAPNCHVSHAAVGGVSASFADSPCARPSGTTSRRARLRRSTARSWPSPCSCSGSTSPGSSSSAAPITATIPLLTSGRFADSYKRGNDFLTGVALLKTLWRHRREGETSVGITTLADEVDSYPQAARRILLRLAEKGYCVEIMSEKPKSHSDWALLCDPSAKSLRDALHGASRRRHQPSH